MQKLVPIAEKISLDVFDAMAPDDWYAPIVFSWEHRTWTTSLAQVSENPLEKLKEILGETIFNQIIEKQGYKHPKGEFETYTGTYHLCLYYCFLDSDSSDNQTLIVVSCGESQPARWMAYVEGIWEVK